MINPLKKLGPVGTVFLVASVFVALSGLIRYAGRNRLDVSVAYQDMSQPQGESRSGARSQEVRASSLGEGDVSVRYADRLRDASALALGLTLHVLHERISNRRILLNSASVLSGFEQTGLLPPQMTIAAQSAQVNYGTVLSPRGLYIVRYRPTPVTIEVLACGAKGLQDGAVFMVRVPEAQAPPVTLEPQQQAGNFASVFIAPMNDAVIPAEFSSAQAYAAAGWRQEPLRTVPFTAEQLNNLRTWLATYNQEQ